MKTCSKCSKQFIPRSNFAQWCDDCCTYTCDYCGNNFISRRRRDIRFCSLECTNAWQETPQAKDKARRKTISIRGHGKVLICKTCNVSFYVPGWRLDRIGTKYCSMACRDYKADMKGINRILRFPHHPENNGLENAGKRILDDNRIEYEEQQIIGGKFVVDVLIPIANIIIQWDGDFWHANPTIYSNNLHKIQQINIRRDKQCNVYLRKCGYTVLRFWETDVHSSPSWVGSKIMYALANSVKT